MQFMVDVYILFLATVAIYNLTSKSWPCIIRLRCWMQA